MTTKNWLPIQRKIMAQPVWFVIFGNDEPLLSIAVGKEEVRDFALLGQIVDGKDTSPFGIHPIFSIGCSRRKA